MTELNLMQLLKRPQYALLGLIASLISIYLVLVWRIGDLTHLGMSGLFLLAIFTQIWENYPSYYYKHERTASLLAAALLGWVFWESSVITNEHQLQLGLIPFVSAVAVALLASGFQGVVQFRREIIIMLFLGVPSLMLNLVDISQLTASFAAFLLRCGGFEVVQQGISLILPVGSTAVSKGWSGMESMAYLLGIAVICLTLYPVSRFKQVLALSGALSAAFVANSVRIAIMATLAAPEDQQAFLYWQEGFGSLIFGVIAVVLFGLFYWFLYWLEILQNRQQLESQR